jgi:hypothetical protein
MSRLRICLGPVAIAVADALVTLHGQPAAYWAHAYSEVYEDNPLARWLLTTHPAAFLVGNLTWVCCILLGILVLPFRAARFVALAVLFGQAAGVSSWLFRLRFGILWIVLLWLSVRLLVDKVICPRSDLADDRNCRVKGANKARSQSESPLGTADSGSMVN